MQSRHLRLLCGGLLSLSSPGAAMWPFSSGEQQAAQAPQPPPFGFGMPGVVVVESHFGSDPFEDLHRNMQRLVQQSAEAAVHRGLPAGAGAGDRPVALPIGDQLGGLLSAFGDHHAGHFGRSGSFQVDDDHHSRFRITAELPGYKFGGDATGGPESGSPLSVRAVGRSSLVVSGSQQMGPMFTSWQRSFALPKGSDINNISVTYNAASGNLTVDVPRRNSSEVVEAADEGEEESDSDDEMLPPVLRAMRSGLPAVVGQMGPAFMGGPRPSGGFLMPEPAFPDLEEIFGMMGQMHPRFHPPAGGERPVPEDAVVNLVGCFAESQLDKVELKYYGESNAASFNAMYWHARSDHVPYFAMSRHDQPLGHAFTAHGFVHESEKPQWGVYDGCGTHCSDEPERWCGCANEASRGLFNSACATEGEKRFAVYKIGEALRADEDASEEAAKEGAGGASTQQPTVVAPGRPYWQLSSAENGTSAPAIEIVVPKGTVAKANGREVLLYNATEPDMALQPPSQEELASGNAAAAAAQGHQAAEPALKQSDPGQMPQNSSSMVSGQMPATPTPVGKMRLPAAVSPEACAWDSATAGKDGGQVIKCQLDQGTVRSVPIKVIDEL